MSSIHTNWQSIAAQRALRGVSGESASLQTRLASGLRIAEARDNAAIWSIAKTMRSDQLSLSAVTDSLNLGIGVVGAALSAQDVVLGHLDGFRNDMLHGINNPLNLGILQKLNNDMEERLRGILTAIKSASFGGVNLLFRETGDSTTFSYLSGAARNPNGTFAVQTTDMDRKDFTLIDAATANRGLISKRYTYTDPNGNVIGRRLYLEYGPSGNGRPMLLKDSNGEPYDVAFAEAGLDIIDQISQAARDAFATLGMIYTSMTRKLDAAYDLHQIQGKGIGRLIDADMNEESARLKALEMREQLAGMALQLANGHHRNILQLFSL